MKKSVIGLLAFGLLGQHVVLQSGMHNVKKLTAGPRGIAEGKRSFVVGAHESSISLPEITLERVQDYTARLESKLADATREHQALEAAGQEVLDAYAREKEQVAQENQKSNEEHAALLTEQQRIATEHEAALKTWGEVFLAVNSAEKQLPKRGSNFVNAVRSWVTGKPVISAHEQALRRLKAGLKVQDALVVQKDEARAAVAAKIQKNVKVSQQRAEQLDAKYRTLANGVASSLQTKQESIGKARRKLQSPAEALKNSLLKKELKSQISRTKQDLTHKEEALAAMILASMRRRDVGKPDAIVALEKEIGLLKRSRKKLLGHLQELSASATQ